MTYSPPQPDTYYSPAPPPPTYDPYNPQPVAQSPTDYTTYNQQPLAPANTPPPIIMGPPRMGAGPNKFSILVIIFAIISVVLMAVSMGLPWFVMSGSGYSVNYGLTSASSSFSGITMTIQYSDKSMANETAWKNLSNTAIVMASTGIIFSVLLIVMGVLSLKRGRSSLLIIIAILAMVFSLLAPALYASMEPGALKTDNGQTGSGLCSASDICTSFTGNYHGINWGPGTGWMLAISGSIMALLAMIFVFLVPKTNLLIPTVPMAPPPPQPQAQPQYQPQYAQQYPPQYPPQF